MIIFGSWTRDKGSVINDQLRSLQQFYQANNLENLMIVADFWSEWLRDMSPYPLWAWMSLQLSYRNRQDLFTWSTMWKASSSRPSRPFLLVARQTFSSISPDNTGSMLYQGVSDSLSLSSLKKLCWTGSSILSLSSIPPYFDNIANAGLKASYA